MRDLDQSVAQNISSVKKQLPIALKQNASRMLFFFFFFFKFYFIFKLYITVLDLPNPRGQFKLNAEAAQAG